MADDLIDVLNPKPENHKTDSVVDLSELKSTMSDLASHIKDLSVVTSSIIQSNSATTAEPDVSTEQDNGISPEFISAVERIAEKKAAKIFTDRTTIQSWDYKAESDFPLLKDKSSDFYREVHADYKSAGESGPASVYNAAARVESRWNRDQVKRQKIQDAIRSYQVREGRVESSSTYSTNSNPSLTITDSDLRIAQKLGFNAEQLKASRQNYTSRTKLMAAR